MINLSSSWIKSVAWIDGNLQVRTKDGNNYVYLGVSKGTFSHLVRSKSKGSFFNKHIIPKYRCVRLEREKNI